MLKRYFAVAICFVVIVTTLSSCVQSFHGSDGVEPLSSKNTSASSRSAHGDFLQLLRDPHLVHGTLENGMRYVLFRNTTPKDRVSMHLNVQAGSMYERDDQRGIAHYLEHMLFNGSTHFKPGELIEYFQSIGMMFGADANAHTGFFETVYDILLPTGDQESLEKGLLVLQDYAEGALLLESEVERERGVILAEKRERDSVSFRTFEASLAFELPGSRIVRRMPIGVEEVIVSADRELLKSYYDAWYRPETMMIVMVGDFDTALAETLIQSRFSGIQARAPKPDLSHLDSERWKPHEEGEKAFYHHEPEAGNTEVSMGTVAWTPFEPETEQILKSRILARLADQVVQNRLAEDIRSEEAPFSDAGIYSGTFLQNVKYSGISAECEPDRWKESLAYLEKSLRRALIHGFTPSEVNRVKADFVLGLETAVKEASTRKSTPLAREIISSINRNRLMLSPEQEVALLKSYVESLTPEDLGEAFKGSWGASHRLVQVTGNAELQGESDVLVAFHESEKVPVFPVEEKERPPFPYLEKPESNEKASLASSMREQESPETCDGKNGGILRIDTIDDLGVWIVDFSNGVRLNLKPTDFKKGEFIFQADFGMGKASEPENLPGLSMATQSVINGSGVGRLTVDELSTALAGRNVSLGFSVDDGSFQFSGSAASDEVTLLFQLTYTYFVDPGFRPEALSLFKSRYAQMIQEITRTPDGVMQSVGERFLAGGDTRFGMPDMTGIEAISLSNIVDWVTPALAHAPLEISVVGDFDVDEVIAVAGDWIGHLPERERIPRPAQLPLMTKAKNERAPEKKYRMKHRPLKPGQKQSMKRTSLHQLDAGALDQDKAHSTLTNQTSWDRQTTDASASPVEVRLPRFPKGQSVTFSVESRLDKGLVLMAFPTDDFWNIHQTRQLNILAKLFSERLRKALRESLGATYSPYAYNHASKVYDGYGVLRGVVAVSPDMAAKVLEHMEGIASAMVKEGVTKNELDLVLEPILTYIKDMVETNRYWLDSVLTGSAVHPEQLTWAKTIMGDYRSISVKEMNAAASRFLDGKRAARIIVQPSLQ